MPIDETLSDARTERDLAPAPSSPPAGGAWGTGRYLTRVAVKSVGRIVIVPVAAIVRLEAEDNYVRLWADRPYLHKDTLTRLVLRLDPGAFLRVHRSHAVNIQAVRELKPLLHGEYLIVLGSGVELTSGRSYRPAIQQAFGLA
ncbi:MAG: LytTR family DNA-binding domain-containing protein [Betaproteobacteria bacterium]